MAGIPTRGTVASFDVHRGDGTVVTDAGAEHWFHCTAIADGSRDIPVGALVELLVVPGLLGRWEATRLRVLGER